MSQRVAFVVNLWLKGNDVAGFETFERAAADIMFEHGGRIEKVVRCSGVEGSPFEVHVVTFTSEQAFQEYRDDPRLVELRPLRERVIARTEIWQGMQKQVYGPHASGN